MDQAKEALLIALDRLQPGDRFNVIEFNSVTRTLYSAPMPVDDTTLAGARKFVRGLRAQGGTEMLPALTAALSSPRAGRVDAPGRVPHRRRRRQRECAAEAHPVAARRSAPVHDRHRTCAQHVLPEKGGRSRPRHVHVHRRRARSEGQDGRALPQDRKPGADRHRRRLAGRRGRLSGQAARSLCWRADRADGRVREREAGGRVIADGRAQRQGVDVQARARDERQRAGHRRAVGARQDRDADGREAQRRAAGRSEARRRRSRPASITSSARTRASSRSTSRRARRREPSGRRRRCRPTSRKG